MARTIVALSGEQQASTQIPVTLVYVGIPNAEVRLTDTDFSVYLDRNSGGGSMSPIAGLEEFAPGAGVMAPEIQWVHTAVQTEMAFSISNVDSAWSQIQLSGTYRDAPVEVWQGNVTLEVGQPPEAAIFVGAVLVYRGLVDSISTSISTATIRVLPSHISPQTLTIPHRTFTQETFRFLPVPGTLLYFGRSEVPL
jgi:hypothetical protein